MLCRGPLLQKTQVSRTLISSNGENTNISNDIGIYIIFKNNCILSVYDNYDYRALQCFYYIVMLFTFEMDCKSVQQIL